MLCLFYPLASGSGVNVIKLFTTVIYECSQQTRVVVPSKPFQLSLMFADKAGAYQSEDLVSDKHSSLLQTFINYDRKMFYNTGPICQCYKTFVFNYNGKLGALL